MSIATEQAKVGDKIKFSDLEDKRPYTIQARNERYLICTKPYNLKKTVFYTIVDLIDQIRGADNMVIGESYETQEDCKQRLSELMAEEDGIEISHRNRVKLQIKEIWKPSVNLARVEV